jgi:hypothetical protein
MTQRGHELTRVCLLTLVRRDLTWARASITGRKIRAVGGDAGPGSWVVALAESAGISGSDVVRGGCTVQVLQGQVRVRHGGRGLTAFPGDMVVVPDATVWLAALTDAAVVLTGDAG